MKSSLEDIRKKFDNNVEVYSNEEVGQTSAMDSPLVLQMIADIAALTNPKAKTMCDIGCGGGNFTIKILHKLPSLSCTLVDLSKPMLDRAQERVRAAGATVERIVQSAVQTVELHRNHYDIIVAGAVLHHLRTHDEWALVFQKIYNALADGGTFFYWDLIRHESAESECVQRDRYKQYLVGARDETFQQRVFSDIEQEDTPETVTFILPLLLNTGFRNVDVIHKNGMFAALMGKK
jgi:tRNA (cmo5U34)-methyltransferase